VIKANRACNGGVRRHRRMGPSRSTEEHHRVKSRMYSANSRSIAVSLDGLSSLAEKPWIVTIGPRIRPHRSRKTATRDRHGLPSHVVLAARFKGGNVYGPAGQDLDQSQQLYEGRDDGVTTDFCIVLGEVVSHVSGNRDSGQACFLALSGWSRKVIK